MNELIAKGYKQLHTSLTRGYVSRRNNTQIVEKYKGKFGEGYTVKTCNHDSTRYSLITYFVK